jgi:hypothetical protein
MNTNKLKALGLVLLLTLVMGVALSGGVAAETGPGVPDSGTVAGVGIRTFYLNPLSTVTETITIYASSSRETGDNIMYAYHSFDVFASLDISGTGSITITPQVSADNVNWADVTYKYVANTSTTSVVTGTSGLTATTSTSASEQEVTHQIVLDEDGEVDYFTMPMTGYYLRFKMVYSSTGTITPTVKAVGRND